MGIDAQDLDYVVVGATPEQMLADGYQAVGLDFPVFLHPETKHEYALARTERKQGRGYRGFVVDASPDVSLDDDLSRRDLTINAMAQDSDGNLIDPFNGQHDLNSKILRHTTEAFVEDPVRVLRIARFRARFGPKWQIHSSTISLIQSMQQQGELDYLVAERVWKETEKALAEPWPQLFFETLQGLGIFPELDQMRDVPQPENYHPEGDVFVHTMLSLRQAANLGADVATRFAVLMHDIGKPICYAKQGNLRGHETAGLAPLEAFCLRWRIPNKVRELSLLVCEFHLHCHRVFELKPATLFKWLTEQLSAVEQPQRFDQFLLACQSDVQGRGPMSERSPYPQAKYARFLAEKLADFDKKHAAQVAIKKGLKGKEIGDSVKAEQYAFFNQLIKATENEKAAMQLQRSDQAD